MVLSEALCKYVNIIVIIFNVDGYLSDCIFCRMLIDSYYFFYMHVYPSVLVCIVRIIVGSWEIQFRTLSCWKILSVDGAEPLVGRPYMLVF